jgi:hypothetical protein
MNSLNSSGLPIATGMPKSDYEISPLPEGYNAIVPLTTPIDVNNATLFLSPELQLETTVAKKRSLPRRFLRYLQKKIGVKQ